MRWVISIRSEKRQSRYGFNEVAKSPYSLLIIKAISHSTSPLVAILLIAATVYH
ncbi:cation-transporting P-type ATPase [Legionella wadsworthii]|uniref:cation-transporting P-type ATPase n=1 Tax=Legionella wadsworthii TaxID=28088 RepID=UPI0009FC075F